MKPHNSELDFQKHKIAVVIPAYRVENGIANVLAQIPEDVSRIIVVDDCSPDQTHSVVERIAKEDQRITIIRHAQNQGVGGAMVSGFRKALELGDQIIVKVDGDGQMDLSYIPLLIAPLINGTADYTKGNRFRDFKALRQMPWIRRIGNIALGFLSKISTGYWNIFDPTNGYIAIRADVLEQLPLEKIDRSFFFETSMLSNLYLIDAKVMDISMPARYLNEISNLQIRRVLAEFPPKLIVTFFRRVLLKYFLYDFSMASIYLVFGVSLFLFGFIFGLVKWIKYASMGIPAPTGTVILPTLTLMLGIQFLLSAINIDIHAVPSHPVCQPLE